MRKLTLSAAAALPFLVMACAFEAPGEQAADDTTATEVGHTASALELQIQPGYDVPVTGVANANYKPVDDAIRAFMRERCIGSAVIGIGYQGAVVHNRGYGYKEGPPAPGCATAADPFVGGTKIQPNTPMRIGSNSKAVLAAVLRKELKKALSAKRGGAVVTDEDIESLKLIDNGEIELVAPEVRAAMQPPPPDTITSEPCLNGWSRVTLKHLLTHTAGLTSSESAYEELSQIRGLTSTSKLAAQETASGATADAKAALKSAKGSGAYFVPRATLKEIAVAQGNRCFISEPGTKYEYSNSGFTMLGYVLEHITGKWFTAPNGLPAHHALSLLSQFTYAELGFSYGIENSHTVMGTRDTAEPEYRSWSADQQTYYPLVADDKRPWCKLGPSGCDFSSFEAGSTRFNWAWQNEKVGFTYASNNVGAGVGALAAEASSYLAFMSRYTVGKPYGGDRGLYPGTHQHYGALGGAVSWVRQMGGDSMEYAAPGKNADGTMTFDPAKTDKGSCVIPAGVNVIFSMGQSADATCNRRNGCVICTDAECKETESAYSQYHQVVRKALCQVDWSFTQQ